MGIREVSYAFWEHSQQEEPWQYTDWKQLSIEVIRQIADEVHGFGLEVEMVEEGMDDQYRWRIVAVKTSSAEKPATKNCQFCGAKFIPVPSTDVYCSNNCQQSDVYGGM